MYAAKRNIVTPKAGLASLLALKALSVFFGGGRGILTLLLHVAEV